MYFNLNLELRRRLNKLYDKFLTHLEECKNRIFV